MDFITAPLVVGIIFYFIYMVFELFARRGERIFLLEKLGHNLSPVDLSVLGSHFGSLLPGSLKKTFTALRIGCLFIGMGLGLLTGLCIVLYIENNCIIEGYRKASFCSIAYGASVLFFGGLGLVISYIVESRSARDVEDSK
ncbi:MAG: hypothetical protein LBF79_00860 [Dysgonamonadaceae bacterium]|jgi:hypothetical protein|nr:hypothetical protein [Dysgonamonadaceae bacterium]